MTGRGIAMAGAVLVLALALAACLPARKPAPLPPVGAAAVAALREACQRDGGDYRSNGTGGMVCFRTPRDAGKSCTAASDCTTACLARSMTCAPVEPLLGCQEIMNNDGSRITQCIE